MSVTQLVSCNSFISSVIVITCVRSDFLYDYSDVAQQGVGVDHDPGSDSCRYVEYFHMSLLITSVVDAYPHTNYVTVMKQPALF